jgi:hypothetical protein
VNCKIFSSGYVYTKPIAVLLASWFVYQGVISCNTKKDEPPISNVDFYSKTNPSSINDLKRNPQETDEEYIERLEIKLQVEKELDKLAVKSFRKDYLSKFYSQQAKQKQYISQIYEALEDAYTSEKNKVVSEGGDTRTKDEKIVLLKKKKTDYKTTAQLIDENSKKTQEYTGFQKQRDSEDALESLIEETGNSEP